MTPKDKADELIMKFSQFSVGMTTCYLSDKEAKKCSIIAVEEILKAVQKNKLRKFWEDVIAILVAR